MLTSVYWVILKLDDVTKLKSSEKFNTTINCQLVHYGFQFE